ncbi:MAG: DUF2813 domain-containing protein [Planctomycetota bacterium]|nr:DUF2813 domain-containing protein [Planctomycetota bacterium]
MMALPESSESDSPTSDLSAQEKVPHHRSTPGLTSSAPPVITLTRLSLRNFRACARLDADFEPGLTLFIGENDSGKSSLLTAIAALLTPPTQAEPGFSRARTSLALTDLRVAYAPATDALLSSSDQRTSITLSILIQLAALPPDHGLALLVAALPRSPAGEVRCSIRVEASRVGLTSDSCPVGNDNGSSGVAHALREVCQILDDRKRVVPLPDPWLFLDAVRSLAPAIMIRPLRASPAEAQPPSGRPSDDTPRQRVLDVYRRMVNEGRSPVTMPEIARAMEDARAMIAADARARDSQSHLTRVNGRVSNLVRRALQDLISVPQALETTLASAAQLAVARGSARSVSDHDGLLSASTSARAYTMLLLLGAILDAVENVSLAPSASPVLLVDDLGGSLHPIWLASMAGMVLNLPAQKLVTTHAADLLARVPLGSLRRVVRRGGDVSIYRIGQRVRTLDDQRRIAYHLRLRSPASLLARCWLLVEGETEAWTVPELARVMGFEFAVEGIRCIEFAQAGVSSMIRIADDLGIAWHVLADGDPAGDNYVHTVERWRDQSPFGGGVTQLHEPDIEHHFFRHGFDDVFRDGAGLPRVQRTRPVSQSEARHVIRAALKRQGKPAMALAILQAVNQRGPRSIPGPLSHMIRELVTLARGLEPRL